MLNFINAYQILIIKFDLGNLWIIHPNILKWLFSKYLSPNLIVNSHNFPELFFNISLLIFYIFVCRDRQLTNQYTHFSPSFQLASFIQNHQPKIPMYEVPQDAAPITIQVYHITHYLLQIYRSEILVQYHNRCIRLALRICCCLRGLCVGGRDYS